MNRHKPAGILFENATGLVIWIALYLPVLLIGCSSQVRPDSVAAFGMGVSKVRDGVKVAFEDANTLARDRAKAKILENPPDEGLTEDGFAMAVKSSDAAQWDNAFGGMQTYVAGLQSLLLKEASEQFGTVTLNLGKELSEGHAKTSLPPGVAAAFTEAGKVLIEAQQQRDALAAMRKADPAIRTALASMAKLIGNDPRGRSAGESGVMMKTVSSNWTDAMFSVSARFKKANIIHDTEGMKAAINDYLSLMDRRDAELDSLGSLRQSLLSLADAHTAASRGANADVVGIMALLSQKMDDIQTTHNKFVVQNKEPK